MPVHVYAVELTAEASEAIVQNEASQMIHSRNASGRRWRRRAWIVLAAVVMLSGAAWPVFHLDRPFRALTGFVSHTLCSGTFVSGLKPDRVYAETISPMQGVGQLNWALRYEVDNTRRKVKASIVGLFESNAVYREGRGCILLHGDDDTNMPRPVVTSAGQQAVAPALKEIAEPRVVEPVDQRLRAALDRAFAESDQLPLRRTAAIVVIHDGHVVAERYAPGYRVDTPLLGWSVTKSVVNALIGILVRDGRLSVDSPSPVPLWRNPNDPRHALTIDHLLRMTSGLAIDETNGSYDAVSRMLMIERDMAGFAERAELKVQPGTKWEYTSGNTLILSRIIRDAVGGHASDVLAFARRELFEPLGMRNITNSIRSVDAPIGSTYAICASPRDWARFGMLFANDGVVNGRANPARGLGALFGFTDSRQLLRGRLSGWVRAPGARVGGCHPTPSLLLGYWDSALW